jgi:alpha-L-fucosidase
MRGNRIGTEVTCRGARPRIAVALAMLFALSAGLAVAQSNDANSHPDTSPYGKYEAERSRLLKDVNTVGAQGPFKPNWGSLQTAKVPEWYQDAKFGIFIHWGVYSVPAFGSEWYPRLMYQQGSPEFNHHIQTYGSQDRFGYKDFIPLFKAEKFDPAQWATLFRESGAKYVVQVAEHHDGFPMYDSGLTDWSAAKMGPKQDLVGELSKAVRAAGLHFGVSSHRAEHYFFYDGGWKFPSDVQNPAYGGLYAPAQPWLKWKEGDPFADDTVPSDQHMRDWLARDAELVEKYHPDIFYFDWWINQKEFQPYLKRFASFYYNYGIQNHAEGVINSKFTAFPEGASVYDVERGQLAEIRSLVWQTDTSVSNQSWGYVDNDTFKSAESIVWQLIDIVSKNGNLLMNIGPRADGTIPDEVQQKLLSVGKWLDVNGDAIYGTRPWKVYGEGPTLVADGPFKDGNSKPFTSQDIRFTTKRGVLYAIAMGWPKDGEIVIHALGTSSPHGAAFAVGNLAMLGSDSKLEWKQRADGLHIKLVGTAPGQFAFAFRLAPKNNQSEPYRTPGAR